jgi:hypothetical protein
LNALIVAAILFAVVVLAGWPWIFPYGRALLAHMGIRFARVGVLSWAEPKPDAQGMYFTFTGVEIGPRFFGMVTSREARVEKKFPKLIVEGV